MPRGQIPNFARIKDNDELFSKFAEIMNLGVEYIYKIRDVSDNLWLMRAGLMSLIIVNTKKLDADPDVTHAEIDSFDQSIGEFAEDLYKEMEARIDVKKDEASV